jgi:sugar lactone lactonase YvrE
LEGVWWTLNTSHGAFYTNNANTGDFVRVTPDGNTTRVIDISETEGHNVPAGVAPNDGNFYIANLGLFPITPGSSSLYKLSPDRSGKIVRVSYSGEITEVLTGLSFPTAITAGPDGALYVSEFGYGDNPKAGRILQVRLK